MPPANKTGGGTAAPVKPVPPKETPTPRKGNNVGTPSNETKRSGTATGNTAPSTPARRLENKPSAVETIEDVGRKTVLNVSQIEAAIDNLVQEVKNKRERIKQEVIGQDCAVNTLMKGYFQAKLAGLLGHKQKGPRASFLFAGPPGVGKTLLASKAAKAMGLAFQRFDMSEYVTHEAALEFIGSDAVYKDSSEGNFTSFVKENPRCVLLLDEIEKAHISIIHLFLQVLDAGRIRDSKTDEEVSLENAILIFTTNVGKSLYEGSEKEDLSDVSRKAILSALRNEVNPTTREPYFPAAICSRFAAGNIVMFNHLNATNLREIAKKRIRDKAEYFNAGTGIAFEISEDVYTALLFAEGVKADGRMIASRAGNFFDEEIYELLRLLASRNPGKSIAGKIDKIRIKVDLSEASNEIHEMFFSSEIPNVLVFGDSALQMECDKALKGYGVLYASDIDSAVKLIKTNRIDLVLIALDYGMSNREKCLNIMDSGSRAMEFFSFLRSNADDLPVYMAVKKEDSVSEDERMSLMEAGVRDFIRVPDGTKLSKKLDGIVVELHQQRGIAKLARGNNVMTFETAQSFSRLGNVAEIRLFGFKKETAIEADDADDIVSVLSTPDVCFRDVIGAEDAKEELDYFVGYLKNPNKYIATGVKPPKGVLLYGPPGTGKTMLAKAMAKESGVTYLSTEGNSFVKSAVGEGAERVHKLFRIARKYAPSIMFIDEIDAIAKARTGLDGQREDVLTAFLTEMDGFKNNATKPVFVLAATNFDVTPGSTRSLDSALLRRFDRRLFIDLPNEHERFRFLDEKVTENPTFNVTTEKLAEIAMRTVGSSLAELDSITELALRSAIRANSDKVDDSILDEALETFNGGEVKHQDASQLERCARHEAGHALICILNGNTPAYVTVVARGSYGGYVHTSNEDKGIYTKNELLQLIRACLGGRAAEIVFYGDEDGVSTGASGDLVKATEYARRLVCAFGMDERIGLVVDHDETMSREAKDAVRRILDEQMVETLSLIRDNKDKAEILANALVRNSHLSAKDIVDLLGQER